MRTFIKGFTWLVVVLVIVGAQTPVGSAAARAADASRQVDRFTAVITVDQTGRAAVVRSDGFTIEATDRHCEGVGCTEAYIYDTSEDLRGHVRGYSYPARTTICTDGIIYRNNYSTVYWDIPEKCAYRKSSGVVTNSFWLPNCGPGTYILQAFSWKSRSNTQPEAQARTRI